MFWRYKALFIKTRLFLEIPQYDPKAAGIEYEAESPAAPCPAGGDSLSPLIKVFLLCRRSRLFNRDHNPAGKSITAALNRSASSIMMIWAASRDELVKNLYRRASACHIATRYASA